MSVKILFSLLSEKDKAKIKIDLNVKENVTKYKKWVKPIPCFSYVWEDSKGNIYSVEDVENEKVERGEKEKFCILLPFSYVYQNFSHLLPKNNKIPSVNETPNSNITFKHINKKLENKIKLLPEQIEVNPSIIKLLERTHSSVLALKTGFGKTAIAIFTAFNIGLKTFILSHRVNIMEQWVKSLKNYIPGVKVQIVKGKNCKIDKDADFYIGNMSKISQYYIYSSWKDIGTLIVDEAHVICSPVNSKALQYFQPSYSIALSATPFKTNGLGVIIEHYFGPEIISRKLRRFFNVYQLFTNFIPKLPKEEKKEKKLDWNKVLDATCSDENLQLLTVNIIKFFKDKNILVLSKRVELEGKMIYKMLKKDGMNVDIYTGVSKTFDDNCSVLISTFSKSGVGFDFPKLNMLILTSDVDEGMEQYIGRIFRNYDYLPIIIDVTHYKYYPFKKHINNRESIYKSLGGQILPFLKHFPEFAEFEKSQNISKSKDE